MPCDNLEGWDGRGWGGSKREGTHVYPWLIHVAVRQKPTQHCKAIILHLKIDLKKKHKILYKYGDRKPNSMSEIPQGRHLSSKPVLERNKFSPVAVGTQWQCEAARHSPCGSRAGGKCGEKGQERGRDVKK